MILDTGYLILDARYRMLDTGCSIPDARYWMLDTGQTNYHRPLRSRRRDGRG
ncbi:MAG: hypothetical protein ISR63_00645 [Desulfobacterales bacterium]|nr:hypothetical protein [Desulfobacterales bacterium]